MTGGDRRRFRVRLLHSCTLVFLILAWWGGEVLIGRHAGQAETTEKIYKNDKPGYAVQYPSTWFPSGIVYGNAFEIRNYDPRDPRAKAKQDHASLLILDMLMGSPEETNRFLDGLLAQKSDAGREVEVLTIDAHRGVLVKQRLKAQQPGPGVARRLSTGPSAPAISNVFDISTYIANGPEIVHLWGKVSADAAPEIIDEIIQIEKSITFEK